MTTFLTTAFCYLTIDAVASIFIFLLYRHSFRFRLAIKLFLSKASGTNDLRQDYFRMEDRLDREIRNRRILKDRVAKMAPKRMTYDEVARIGN